MKLTDEEKKEIYEELLFDSQIIDDRSQEDQFNDYLEYLRELSDEDFENNLFDFNRFIGIEMHRELLPEELTEYRSRKINKLTNANKKLKQQNITDERSE